MIQILHIPKIIFGVSRTLMEAEYLNKNYLSQQVDTKSKAKSNSSQCQWDKVN